MRSGSRASRYLASRSCAFLSGPPVSRTADRGSGRAACGMAGAIGAPLAGRTNAMEASVTKVMNSVATRDAAGAGSLRLDGGSTLAPRLLASAFRWLARAVAWSLQSGMSSLFRGSMGRVFQRVLILVLQGLATGKRA